MAFDYGYGKLENQLINLFRSGPPDFKAAEHLIEQGANLNAVGNDPDENMLSEILFGYRDNGNPTAEHEECKTCEAEHCGHCKFCTNPQYGEEMVNIIRFFLEHGFDVQKDNGRYGALCLNAIILSTFDRHMVTALKLLFDAGARNMIMDDADDFSEPKKWTCSESSYAATCLHDHPLANIYEAMYQMYLAIDEGRPYNNIDSYEAAIGKRILRVLSEKPKHAAVFFDLDLPTSRHQNCFRQTLYFILDGCYLTATEYAEFWTDSILPDKELVDVSDTFSDIIGAAISDITFDHRSITKNATRYGQPIVTLNMDNGIMLAITINFGEVDDKADRVAYYSLHR